MWELWEHRRLVRVLSKLPEAVLKRYEKWKDVVRISGPQGLRAIKGFHDEALKGDRKGQRSSRLNQQYRVIYEISAREVLVYVLEVTAHDYRRK
jgi:plasmid maintenance system killer protein